VEEYWKQLTDSQQSAYLERAIYLIQNDYVNQSDEKSLAMMMAVADSKKTS
jgi:hypothetical protein